MKLGAILDGARSRRPVVQPVSFRVVATNSKEQVTTADAQAVLVFVSEDDREQALIDAAESLSKRFPGKPIPSEVRIAEEAYHFLATSLRDKDDPAQPFASSVDELRGALTAWAALQLQGEYGRFVEAEFPDSIDDKTFEELIEAAEKKSLRDLLCSFGYSQTRKALPILAGRYGVSLTQT